MVFNSNMPTKLEFQALAEDRFAQKSIDVYRGFVQLYTEASQVCQPSLTQSRSSKPTAVEDGRRRSITTSQNAAKVACLSLGSDPYLAQGFIRERTS